MGNGSGQRSAHLHVFEHVGWIAFEHGMESPSKLSAGVRHTLWEFLFTWFCLQFDAKWNGPELLSTQSVSNNWIGFLELWMMTGGYARHGDSGLQLVRTLVLAELLYRRMYPVSPNQHKGLHVCWKQSQQEAEIPARQLIELVILPHGHSPNNARMPHTSDSSGHHHP